MKKNFLKNLVFVFIVIMSVSLPSCRTTQLDVTPQTAREKPLTAKEKKAEKKRAEQEKKDAAKKAQEARIEEELKEVDVEKTVIYIDRPVYSPIEQPPKTVEGTEAIEESQKAATQVPMKFVNGIMYYPYDETFVYEIHCQPYRTTDIMLEPGEVVIEMPFMSEDRVWEVGAGVSRKDGQDVQHFFVKPSWQGLTTSMIIITDRRVYHLILKSFKERYMVMVRWEYPDTQPFRLAPHSLRDTRPFADSLAPQYPGRGGSAQSAQANSLKQDTSLVDPAFLSFDYKMSYSAFVKPAWLPTRIYDDGRKTYIELDEQMLNKESPVLFNKWNERINYRVQKNLIIIDELIERVTLKRGSQSVRIEKKRYAGKKDAE